MNLSLKETLKLHSNDFEYATFRKVRLESVEAERLAVASVIPSARQKEFAASFGLSLREWHHAVNVTARKCGLGTRPLNDIKELAPRFVAEQILENGYCVFNNAIFTKTDSRILAMYALNIEQAAYSHFVGQHTFLPSHIRRIEQLLPAYSGKTITETVFSHLPQLQQDLPRWKENFLGKRISFAALSLIMTQAISLQYFCRETKQDFGTLSREVDQKMHELCNSLTGNRLTTEA